MVSEFELLCKAVRSAATDAGMVVFDGTPDLINVPTVLWHGEWDAFIDLAHKANASLLYIHESKYDPDTLIDEIIGDEHTDAADGDDVDDREFIGGEDNWLQDRLREVVTPWNFYRDSPRFLECVWVKDGVFHVWQDEAAWAAEHREAVQNILDEAKTIGMRDRGSRSEAAAQKLHMYANILAIHPRFPEAKSEEKREYMVDRMFGDDLRKEPPIYQLLPHLIARRALLIYWWDIEPGDRASIEERIRELRESGESIKNIAAILHISDARVRAALKSEG
jgi:hypothetical protein